MAHVNNLYMILTLRQNSGLPRHREPRCLQLWPLGHMKEELRHMVLSMWLLPPLRESHPFRIIPKMEHPLGTQPTNNQMQTAAEDGGLSKVTIKMDQTQKQSIGITEVMPIHQANGRTDHRIRPSSLLARALICILSWRKKHPPAAQAADLVSMCRWLHTVCAALVRSPTSRNMPTTGDA